MKYGQGSQRPNDQTRVSRAATQRPRFPNDKFVGNEAVTRQEVMAAYNAA